MIRIFISDPQPVVRAGLRTYLNSCPEFDVVGESGELAVRTKQPTEEAEPDILLFGHETYHLAWDHLVEHYIADPARVKVVLLASSFKNVEHFAAALRAGFRGIFLKQSPLESLRTAILSVYSEQIWCDHNATPKLLESLISDVHSARREHPLDRLSKRQHEIVGLVTQGLSNNQIANKIHVSQATVAYELTQIYRGLKVSDRMQLLLSLRNAPPHQENWQTG